MSSKPTQREKIRKAAEKLKEYFPLGLCLPYNGITCNKTLKEYIIWDKKVDEQFPNYNYPDDDHPIWKDEPKYTVGVVETLAGDTPTKRGAAIGIFLEHVSADLVLALLDHTDRLEKLLEKNNINYVPFETEY